MRILHLVHQYPPDYVGGTELYTQQLARALQARGHTNGVFFRRSAAGHGLTDWLDDEGIRVWAAWDGDVTPTGRFRALFGNARLDGAWAEVLSAFAPDLVHVQHLMGLPASLLQQLSRRGIPYIVTLHDYWWRCANAQLITNDTAEICAGPRWWLNCGRCALARAGRGPLALAPAIAPALAWRQARLTPLLRRARRLIAPTNFTKDTYAPLGLPADKIVAVPHGIEPPPSPPPPAGPAKIAGGPLQIVYLGGIAWQKGVHVLIDAVNGLPSGTAAVTIYGNMTAFPEYAAGLRARAGSAVHFAGRLPHAEIWPALAAADVLAVPSLWYETAALVIQEAFAAGVPVLAADIGALAERVQDGVDGRRLPPGDVSAWQAALATLAADRAQLARFRDGIRPVRTMAEHVEAVLAVYAE